MTATKFFLTYLLTAAAVAGLIAILPGPASAMVAVIAGYLLTWSFAAFFVLGLLACVVTILASHFRA